MRIGGRRVREHIRFLWPLFGFIAVVWALRLVADAVAPNHRIARFFSLTAAAPLAVLLAVLMIHVRRFGGYKNVVIASLLLVAWSHLLIMVAIVFSVVTGLENVFTAPEFSVPLDDRYHVRHILGHVTLAIGGGLMGAGIGCVLLYLLRLLVPSRPPDEESQSGAED
ncbi:MAG TPA: hypothetical protein VJH03_20595 [Blastocatellia bacterium]|nr:hypothetical protein [Blastocatellia bacterium]